MGFSSVYKALQDVFPQLDSRILRAVAIEHPKDADLAVEVVLAEVLPHLSEQSQTMSSSNKSESSLGLSEVVVYDGKTAEHEGTIDPVDVVSSLSEPSTEAGPSSIGGNLAGAVEAFDAGSSGQPNTPRSVEQLCMGSLGTPSFLDANAEPTKIITFEDPFASMGDRPLYERYDQEHVGFGGKSVAVLDESFKVCGTIRQVPGSMFDVATPGTKEEYRHLDVDTETLNVELDKHTQNTVSENEALEDEKETSGLTRSEQTCSTELLEDIIQDARNSKKTLMLTMDSIVDLMREVEEKEKAAEEAKEEAKRDCSHILTKVDELKQALGRAREANDMHAGEVYAEKAILATELKELQLRLFTLSDENNKSLAILDEMRRGLEIRLAAALKEIMTAEEEKLEKQKSAREALAYQESQLENVVEESKKLKQEAEENSKLQEFLMDRGRAIDILQGEVSVKCQDVRVLKEKFDKRIPLSRSLSSSQTSSILACSSSSFRTTATPSEPEEETFETPKMKNLDLDDSYGFVGKSSVESQPPKSLTESVKFDDDCSPSGGEKGKERVEPWKLLLEDDDWELFDGELSAHA